MNYDHHTKRPSPKRYETGNSSRFETFAGKMRYMNPLRFYFLGSPRIEQNGRMVEPDTRKATALLAYLALSGERPSRDWLAAFLWPDFDDSHAKAALRRTLSALKTAVGPEVLNSTREAISLQPDHVWCDVTEFRRLLADVVDESGLETAVVLYRDDFLTGFTLRDSLPFDDWQIVTAQTLRRELETALEKLVNQASVLGNWQKSLTLAHRWLALDPLREEVHCQLMRIYTALGQPNAALRQYRDCVRILEEELGVPPLPETTALYQAIQENRLTAVPPAAPPLPLSPAPLPLVGRAAEMAQMRQVYRQIEADGRFLAVTGEMGVGKSRLAEDFLAWAHGQGARVLTARCYEGESSLAYAPIVQLLRDGLALEGTAAHWRHLPPHTLAEAARLLPELAVEASAPVAWDPGAESRFVTGVTETLAALLSGPAPGILWLDDAHWLDSASLEMLLFLLRRMRRQPYLILLCWREEEMPVNHDLPRVVAAGQQRGQGACLHLPRLNLADVTELVTAVTPTLSAAIAPRLHQETDGLPFFVVEYLYALLQTAMPTLPDAAWTLPPTVRELLHARLAQVHAAERQILQAAAVIGHPFPVELAQAASGRSEEEVVTALETLAVRGILLEQAAHNSAVYDFNHEKLRTLAYEEMSLARRRLLHRRLADALAGDARRHPPNALRVARIATHYRQAGRDDEATAYFAQAGDLARALYAHQEALTYYQSALALVGRSAQTWRLHQACGDVYVRLGDYAAALARYETAVSLAPTAESAPLEHKLAQVYMRQGEWLGAERQLALAAERYGELGNPDDLARLAIDCSHTHFSLGQRAAAVAWAEQARALAVSPQSQAQSWNILGILARHEADYAAASVHLAQSLALAEQHNLPEVQVAALNNLALAETAVGHTPDAFNHLQAALALCQQYGDRHREAALHNNLADLYHQVGDEAAAMAALKTAVAIYADIGGQPGVWQPEIWKLAAW
jgi:DNA-binding SARP family transcriptional activator